MKYSTVLLAVRKYLNDQQGNRKYRLKNKGKPDSTSRIFPQAIRGPEFLRKYIFCCSESFIDRSVTVFLPGYSTLSWNASTQIIFIFVNDDRFTQNRINWTQMQLYDRILKIDLCAAWWIGPRRPRCQRLALKSIWVDHYQILPRSPTCRRWIGSNRAPCITPV